MADRREPNVKDISLESGIDSRLNKFIRELREKVSTHDIGGTQVWRMKMITARNQRHGIKRVTNFPYPGAPDIPLPQSDKLIRKQKSNMVMSAISGKTLMSITPAQGQQEITPELNEKARKSELVLNDLFKNKIGWVKKLVLAADKFLEKGHCIFKIVEKFSSRQVEKIIDLRDLEDEQVLFFKALDKKAKIDFIVERFGFNLDIPSDKITVEKILKDFSSGKDVIKFNIEEVKSLPDVLVVNPEKIFVARGGGADISKSLRVTHEYFLDESVLVDRMIKGIYLEAPIKKILKMRNTYLNDSSDDLNDRLKDRIEGIEDSGKASDYFRIHEILTFYQPKDGVPFERWVFVFLADVTQVEDSLIQRRKYQFEEDEWNYVKHDNEIIDDRYYSSRGIPEQIRAIQEFEEKAINNMLIRDEINNAPMYTVLNTSKLQSNQVRFIPGQRIGVNDHSEIRPLTEPRNIDVSSMNIAQILKAYAEEYLGSTDQLFRNATNSGGGKTLGEIQLGAQIQQNVQSLDTTIWLDSLSKVYLKVFNVLKERLTIPLIINGEIITREDFQFDPEIRANGSLELSDKQFQAQKALNRLGIIRQAKGDGCATLDDLFNGYADYLEKDGVSDPAKFLENPENILKGVVGQLEQKANQLQQVIVQQQKIIESGSKNINNIKQELRGRIDEESRE